MRVVELLLWSQENAKMENKKLRASEAFTGK